MRSGGCILQQSLSAEAANVVKQAVTLASRRGHAQVTPLHVANTMLSASAGLLRMACLQSLSHPFNCKALELCFNVALNRLPASICSPMLGNDNLQSHPSISNALIAAFKRAQAHQRRGSVDNQNQPFLALKIELDQLIISILDDPSVSRVMKEAGFSSTQVKNNVEKAVSMDGSPPTPMASQITADSSPAVSRSPSLERNSLKDSDDVEYVIENLMNKNTRCTVIVGECFATIEGVLRGVADKLSRGDVPDTLRDLTLHDFSLCSFEHLPRECVDQELSDLKSYLKSYVRSGVVLVLGDLKWVIDYRINYGEHGRNYFSPVEHMIMELGKLACDEDHGRLWLLALASLETFRRLKSEQASLETLWGLHPLAIPRDSISLSLITERIVQNKPSSQDNEQASTWFLQPDAGTEMQHALCPDCSNKSNVQARSLQNGDQVASTRLPPWLQQYKDENQNPSPSNNSQYQEKTAAIDLRQKWNIDCYLTPRQTTPDQRKLTLASRSPNSSTSLFSYDPHNSKFSYIQHTSLSSSDVVETDYTPRFKELNAENLNTICNALERKIPQHKETIPGIASTILKCRSGMIKRKGDKNSTITEAKQDTWLFFLGDDRAAKEKLARELQGWIFSSRENLVSISLSSFTCTNRNKRCREESSFGFFDGLAEAMSINPHRVFLIEDIDQIGYRSQMCCKQAIENGYMTMSSGDEVGLSDAIVIFSCESFKPRYRDCSPNTRRKRRDQSEKEKDMEEGDQEMINHGLSLDLNVSCEDQCGENEVQSLRETELLESMDGCVVLSSNFTSCKEDS